MMWHRVASRKSYHHFSNGTSVTIANGEPIQVESITLNNAHTTLVLYILSDADSNIFAQIRVLPDTSKIITIPFIADKGLKISVTNAAASVTVYHYSPGT